MTLTLIEDQFYHRIFVDNVAVQQIVSISPIELPPGISLYYRTIIDGVFSPYTRLPEGGFQDFRRGNTPPLECTTPESALLHSHQPGPCSHQNQFQCLEHYSKLHALPGHICSLYLGLLHLRLLQVSEVQP